MNIQDKDKYFQQLLTICKTTGENESSMLKDILNGRKTEIDGIIGVLIHKAKQEDKPAPLLQFMYRAIKGMEG